MQFCLPHPSHQASRGCVCLWLWTAHVTAAAGLHHAAAQWLTAPIKRLLVQTLATNCLLYWPVAALDPDYVTWQQGSVCNIDRAAPSADAASSPAAEPAGNSAQAARNEDLHKPAVVAFQAMIDTFVRARQLK